MVATAGVEPTETAFLRRRKFWATKRLNNGTVGIEPTLGISAPPLPPSYVPTLLIAIRRRI